MVNVRYPGKSGLTALIVGIVDKRPRARALFLSERSHHLIRKRFDEVGKCRTVARREKHFDRHARNNRLAADLLDTSCDRDRAYILKGVSAAELKSAIFTVFNNESFVSPEFATKLLSAAQNKTRDAPIPDTRLSFRESQILREVEAGLSNRMVAEKLRISEKTVKYYMSSIMQKYGVSNRVSAVVAYQKVRRSQPNARQDEPVCRRSPSREILIRRS